MKKRICSILLTVCLLLGLMPTIALAGGGIAMFSLRHDTKSAADTVCSMAGREILLPGTHAAVVPEDGFVEFADEGEGDTYNYIVNTTFAEFKAACTSWSLSWEVTCDGKTIKTVGPGQTTSITFDCRPLKTDETFYTVYVSATLTATYKGRELFAREVLNLTIEDPIYELPESDDLLPNFVDRGGADTHHVPLDWPKTITKYTTEKPQGEEIPIPEEFVTSYTSYPTCFIETDENGSKYLVNPEPGHYRVAVSIKEKDGTLISTQSRDYYVTDGDILAKRHVPGNPNAFWTLTKDGTLTFSGQGEVPGVKDGFRTDWAEFVDSYSYDVDRNFKITKVVVEEGITKLGSNLLRSYDRATLEFVTLPSTLKTLEDNVFKDYRITKATCAGDWETVTVGEGNDNLDNLLQKPGIKLWVEGERLYGKFTDPGAGGSEDQYKYYRLYFYDTKESNPDYIYVRRGTPGKKYDFTQMYSSEPLDGFAVFESDARPNQGDKPLYVAKMTKPIQSTWDEENFAFPSPNVTVAVTENTGDDSQYAPYIVTFTGLDPRYFYEMYKYRDDGSCWGRRLDGDTLHTDDKIFGDCTITAIHAEETDDKFLTSISAEYPITISDPANPALPKQEIMIPGSAVTKTYGEADFYNEVMNATEGGGELTYTSADTNVATVDATSGKVTIKGAGETDIIVTAAAVPDTYAETKASYKLTVNKASLTVKADDASVVYGQSVPAFTWTAEGFKYNDNKSAVEGEAVYTCGYTPLSKADSTHDITLSGLTAKNYDITFAKGTLTVNKATEYKITLDKLEQLAGHTSAVTATLSPYDADAKIKVEYKAKISTAWAEDVPTEAGEYDVRASLVSASNITADPAKYTEGTLVIKQGVTVNTGAGTTDVGVTVDTTEGTANITAKKEDIEKINTEADGNISIDLGGAKDVDQLVLPGDLVSTLSKNDKAESLTVATEDASITMSAPVMDTVAKAVTNEEDKVEVVLKSVGKDELSDEQQKALESIPNEAAVVDVSIVITHPDNTKTTLYELGGDVEVTVPCAQVPEVVAGQYVVACHVSDNGVVTYLFATHDAVKNTITFTTTHFSNYAVFVSEKPSVVVNGGSGSGLYDVGETVTIQAESKSGYRFEKWNVVSGDVALDDSSKEKTTFTMPGKNVVIAAVYEKISSGGGGGSSSSSATITAESVKNGAVTISPRRASKGELVTITAKPDPGYKLKELTVTDQKGNQVKLSEKEGSFTFTMPDSKVTVAATFIEAEAMAGVFADVSQDAYYYEPVKWAVKEGITSGTSAAAFSPEKTCTRAQTVTFLWKAMGSPEPVMTENPFSDIASDAYYYKAVLWALEQGITSGTTEATFSPDAFVTRAQTVTFLWKTAQSPKNSAENHFADVPSDSYYADAVCWAAQQGITSGTSATTFNPGSDCTRAQIVTFLFRAMEK